jgi:hypothetical protein
MRRARHHQRDLFDKAAQVAEIRCDLRVKLTPLLQALLSEAAGVELRQSGLDDLGDKEAGDDQDHA